MEHVVVLRLTEPQQSALECRDWSEDPVMLAAWDGGRRLSFAAADREALVAEVCAASNAEDDHARVLRAGGHADCARRAARAAAVLANLQTRIARS